MVKEVNRYTTNEFHDWQRKNLPGRFVIQDLDTWPILISDGEDNYNPLFIVELKRSFIEPEKWDPFKADLPNYQALYKLANKAQIPFITIYFKKEKDITDDSVFAIFKINAIKPSKPDWISYDKKVITAKEFREKFPNIY